MNTVDTEADLIAHSEDAQPKHRHKYPAGSLSSHGVSRGPAGSASVVSTRLDYPPNHLSVVSHQVGDEPPCTLTLRVYPSWILLACTVACISSGVFGSIVFKWQNKIDVKVCSTCKYRKFEGALYQTQMMFFAETCAFVVYYFDKYFSAKANKARLFDFARDRSYYETKEGPFWIWPFCSLFDFAATLMIMCSLKLTYASTVQMLRNIMIVECLILQVFMVKKAVRVHELIGVVVIFGAMILTAVPALSTPDTSTNASQSDTIIGCILALAGTTLQSVQLILEEVCMRRGRSAPMRSVGWEGLGGVVWSMIAWPICQKSGLENISDSWRSSLHSGLLTATSLIYLPTALIFNVSGLATTMLGSGMLRGVCFAVRSPLVWVVSLIVKWQKYEHWSLASAIIFCIGFAGYINATGFRHGTKIDRWLSQPIHCCGCLTNRDLDDPYDEVDVDDDDDITTEERSSSEEVTNQDSSATDKV